MEKEVWLSVENWEDFYEVSSLGRVRSLSRSKKNGNNKYLQKGKVLKLASFSNGYLFVQLPDKPRKECRLVHRLVAEAFIPNPDNKKEVNHISGDKTDNRVVNLEWATRSENLIHRHRVLGIVPDGCKNSKKIRCIETGQEFQSISECSRVMGLWKSQISAHLLRKKGNACVGGFHFEYVELEKES